MPHLQRAAMIRFQAQDAGAMLGGLSDVADRSVTAMLLLEREGKVKFANQAARAMAAHGDAFSLRGGQFEIANRNDDAALQRLIAGATGALREIGAARGGVLRLARNSGKASYTVTVAPVRRETSWIGNAPMAMVLISDPEVTPIPSREMLHQLFGLSASESRVAERLMTLTVVTPGGTGPAEAGMVAVLIALGADATGSLAGVLLFRAFVVVAAIPAGALAGLGWWSARQGRGRNPGGRRP